MSVEQFLTDKERIRALEECISSIFTIVLTSPENYEQGLADATRLRDEAVKQIDFICEMEADTPADHRVFRAAKAFLEAREIGFKPREGLVEELLAEELNGAPEGEE